MPCDGLGKYIAEIGGQFQIPAIVKIVRAQSGPVAVNLSAFHGSAHHKHHIGMAVIGAGGRLVYATCSLEPEENQQVVEEALGSSPGFRLLTAAELMAEFPYLAPLFEAPGYFRTRPGEYGLDGFFAAAIVRARL